jgi:glycosyltransferase involved in cell wall biosynthesis
MTPLKHVLLNALYLAPGVSGGPETYLRGLAPALVAEFPGLELTVATTPSGAAALRADGWEELARVVELPCEDGQRIRRQWAEQVLLPRVARRRRADVVHSLASVAPVYAGARSVVTLHDVTFLTKATFGRLTTWGMGSLVKAAARRADRLIVGTAAARDEICSVLGTEASRFTVVHHGHDATRSAHPTSAEELRSRYGLGDSRVVLCVAAKRPHKNQELLIRAATMLDPDIAVVLAGHPEPYELELRALVRELDLERRVRFVDYVPDSDLEGLWSLASCAAFPTLGEGFGIPVLEALAHGVPVACSRLAALEEVGGALPHYFDPHDPADAVRAIREALADVETAIAGPVHARGYTWRAAAQLTYETYERALARPTR